MSDNPYQGPEWDDLVQQVTEDLAPKVRESILAVAIAPVDNGTDVKLALELGLMILFNKPIIVVVGPGRHVPPKLEAVADYIVWGNLEDEEIQADLKQALTEIMEKIDSADRGDADAGQPDQG